MLALSDSQLEIVMAAAASLPTEKRATFLERMAGQLERRGRHDADFDKAVQRALQGLIQNSAA